MGEDRLFRDQLDPARDDYKYEEWPFYNMVRLVALYHQRVDAALKPIGMDVARWRVLSILGRCERATITQISVEAVTRMSTMAKIIQRMNAQGLVATEASREDARSTDVFLTPHGAAMLEVVKNKIGTIARQAFYDISDDDLNTINTTSRKIYENLSP